MRQLFVIILQLKLEEQLQFSGTNSLQINGNFINNGTFTAGSGTVEFTGAADNSISGTSNTTFNNLILNKGTSNSSDLNVQSDITIGNLTFNNGVLNVNSGGTATITNITNNNNIIPSTSGLVVSGGTLNTGNYTILNQGLILVTSGTANFGTDSGNSVHTEIDGVFRVTGGTVNIAGRLENTAGGTLGFYQSGITILESTGTTIINLSTVGNGASGVGFI